MDYRYFPDPDLLPLSISEEWIEEIRANMRPQQQVLIASLVHQGVSAANSITVTSTSTMATFHGTTARKLTQEANIDPNEAAIIAANWIVGEISNLLNQSGTDISKSPVSENQLAKLLAYVKNETISRKIAKEVLQAMWNGEGDADAIIKKRGLKQIADSGEIEKIVDQVLAANAQQVADYRGGKEKAFNSLVGQVMKATKGKANPAQVNEILKRRLAG